MDTHPYLVPFVPDVFHVASSIGAGGFPRMLDQEHYQPRSALEGKQNPCRSGFGRESRRTGEESMKGWGWAHLDGEDYLPLHGRHGIVCAIHNYNQVFRLRMAGSRTRTTHEPTVPRLLFHIFNGSRCKNLIDT
jgi:hypothetical protein